MPVILGIILSENFYVKITKNPIIWHRRWNSNMSRSVIAKLLSNHYFTGIHSQLKKKFMRLSWQSSHCGDMILTVKHNFDAFCLIAINSNFSPLLMYYETLRFRGTKREKATKYCKDGRESQCERWKSTGFSSNCM